MIVCSTSIAISGSQSAGLPNPSRPARLVSILPCTVTVWAGGRGFATNANTNSEQFAGAVASLAADLQLLQLSMSPVRGSCNTGGRVLSELGDWSTKFGFFLALDRCKLRNPLSR